MRGRSSTLVALAVTALAVVVPPAALADAIVVDYTVGTATKDRAKQDKAVGDLVGYTQDFGAFLSSANPNLPKSGVADLVKHHVVTLKDVIDAQARKDPAKAYQALRSAADHMQMIADPLAEAIVKQFPDRFRG